MWVRKQDEWETLMGKEKSQAVTTIDVLVDKAQRQKMCCVKIITHLYKFCPTIRHHCLSLSVYVCVSVSWTRVAYSKAQKSYVGLRQHRQQQGKQQQQKTTTTRQLGHSCFIFPLNRAGPTLVEVGLSRGDTSRLRGANYGSYAFGGRWWEAWANVQDWQVAKVPFSEL